MPSLTGKSQLARRVPLRRRFEIWIAQMRLDYLRDEAKFEWGEIERAKDRIASLDTEIIRAGHDLSTLKLK